ncbi:MAG: hypothetical protein AAF693_08530 [Bacteroidota bacterium]
MSLKEFTRKFEKEVASDRLWNIIIGWGGILFGLLVVAKGLIEGENHYIFAIVTVSFGAIVLYHVKHRLRISEHQKLVTDLEIHANLNSLLKAQNVGLLERYDNYFKLFVKPKGLSAWHEVHILVEKSNIYINARQIFATLVDGNSSKNVESKLIYRLNRVSKIE